GVYLLYTATTFGWAGLAPGPARRRDRIRARDRVTDWLAQAGLSDVRLSELAAVMAVLAAVGGGAAFALFGGIVPGLVTRTCAVLKSRLADPTADATCETLLVAHEIGGTDLDRRLASLVEDRIQDLHGRKDARAKQAGVRFARRFVLAVPVGMALAGLSIG